MLKSRFFWNLFLSYLLLVLMTVTALGLLLYFDLAAESALLAVGAVVGVILSFFFGLLVARRVTTPLAEITEVAEAIRNGQYERRVCPLTEDEIGLLGDTLNRLLSELTGEIRSASHERAQFESILAGMAEGVLAVDQSDRVLFCNQSACDFLGRRRPKNLLGQPLEPGHVDLLDLIADARQEQRSLRQDFDVERQGQELILEAQATPFHGGDVEGIVIVLHDITELRRLERIRRDFVANVSHELKTPLTSIKGFVETLLSGALYDEKNNLRFLKKINKHVEQLSHLVADLLNLARIESQKEPSPNVPVSWEPIIVQGLRHHETALKEKELELELVMAKPKGSVKVLGDPDGMSQILENLLDNAIKYTPARGRITIRVFQADGHGTLEVEDSGIGIPREDIDHIFERFYRVDKARSRELGGTGLGLSIVKHLANSMDGEIQVESEFGHGTCFRVLIPDAKG